MKRVMFYCQHVLGMGHLVRSSEIVRALSRDFEVLFVVGGETTPDFLFPNHIQLLQLPPLKTDPEFTKLEVCDPSLGLEETKALRREQLVRSFELFQPDALVTELFPFGRKQFGFELMPLLERARRTSSVPLVASSIRDLLVTKKDQVKHERYVSSIVNAFYDVVLVHGDEKFQKLEDTFSQVRNLRCPVEYTGYVVQQKRQAATEVAELSPRPAIVVSDGSGGCRSGHLLLESVLRAAPLVEQTLPHEFRVFAGPLMPGDVYERLEALARLARNVRFARYTPDLPGQFRRAELSVSMAGYNTVMDILSSQVRALVYPVTANGDQEQSLRAAKLARMGVLGVLNQEQLEPVRLALKIRETLRGKSSRPSRPSLNLAGAQNTALLLQKHLALRNPRGLQNQGAFNSREKSWGDSHQGGNIRTIGERAPCA